MINLERLRVFHAVAQTGSFTRAAEVLHLTQPGISKHIRHLEDELGTPLFDRMGRKVSLTQPGEILFQTALEVIGAVLTAEQRIQELTGLRNGRLRLGASFPIALYVLPRVLADFRKQHPAIDVTLAISTSANIEAKVLANRVDLGLVSHDVHHPKLVSRQFMTDELVVIVPANHAWASRRRIRVQELVGQTFIVAARGAGTRSVVDERLLAKGIVLQNVLDFVNAEGVKHAVEAGLGVSIQSRGIVQGELRSGSLKAIHLANMDAQIRYVHIHRKGRHVSSAQAAFLEMLLQLT